MKVLYDYQIFDMQKYGGISRYFYELISRLSTYEDISPELSLKYSKNTYLLTGHFSQEVSAGKSTDDFLVPFYFFGKTALYNTLTHFGLAENPLLVNKLLSLSKIRHGQFDVFHPTYYNPYFLRYLKQKPLVLTIYDMIHELYGHMFINKHDLTIHHKRLCAQRADRIITISENTKKDIVNILGIDENKISVIYLGNSLVDKSPTGRANQLPERYILYVGERRHYKNFNLFLKAITPILLKEPEIKLICAGSHFFSSDEKILIEDLQISNSIIYQKIMNDQDLVSLYKNALCFVFPSLYEGFGIPVLESFYCGCPSVLSNNGALNEIAGEAALYFDPLSTESIYDAVSKVINNESLRYQLALKGKEQLKKYSWEKCAMQTKSIYKSLIVS